MKKKCSKCGEIKDVEEFGKEKLGKYGVRSYCKICRKQLGKEYREKYPEKNKIWRENNKEKNKTQKEEYYKMNKEEIALQHKIYYGNNKEDSKERMKIYRENNKDELAIRRKEYYESNKEKFIIRGKEYRENKKEEIVKRKAKYYKNNKEKINEYRKNCYATKLNFKLRHLLRGRLRKALKNNSKYSSAIKLLGCTIEELKQYLENKFIDNMSWDNWSLFGWHIDHIIPCISFDLTDPEQQKECFHYSNLQPLWAKDNLSKGSKYEY